MPNNYLSVLYKHIIQVENKNVGLKVCGGGAQTYHCPPSPPPNKKGLGGIIHTTAFFYTSRGALAVCMYVCMYVCVYICMYVYVCIYVCIDV